MIKIYSLGSKPIKNRKIFGILSTVLALNISFLASAFGHEIPLSTVADQEQTTQPGASKIAFKDLGVFESNGESKTAFVKKVAGFLANYTQSTGFEACGMLQQHSTTQRFKVRLITNHSQVVCAQIVFNEPGFVNLGQSIHSHPQLGPLVINSVDELLTGMPCGKTIHPDSGVFSYRDLQNSSSSYLVVPKFRWESAKILFQKDGKVTNLGKIFEPSAPHYEPTPSFNDSQIYEAVQEESFNNDTVVSCHAPRHLIAVK